MAFRDRFFTPTTARALLSWRLLLGVAAGVIAGFGFDLNAVASVLIGAGVYAASVLVAMPRPARPPAIDPFTISEPWRWFVKSTQRSRNALHETLRSTKDGPLKERLADVAKRIDKAIEESWQIARRGDEIDAAIKRIDPPRLRSQLETLQSSGGGESSTAAVESVESQLASADRLKQLSASTVDRLRLTQARLDELVARASEVSIGRTDTESYKSDVDDLVIELEGLRLAVAETNEIA
jgi:hypothetical protein